MAFNDDADRLQQRSHLFMLRVWLEDLGSGKIDWRGKIQHVSSGEARYIRDWPTLEAFVEELIQKANRVGNPTGGMEEADQ